MAGARPFSRSTHISGTTSGTRRSYHRGRKCHYGETKGEKKQEKRGSLPLHHYTHLTIAQIKSELESLSKGDIQKVKAYEQKHKNRKGAMETIHSALGTK